MFLYKNLFENRNLTFCPKMAKVIGNLQIQIQENYSKFILEPLVSRNVHDKAYLGLILFCFLSRNSLFAKDYALAYVNPISPGTFEVVNTWGGGGFHPPCFPRPFLEI